ncbi:zinc ribbon domain-containing protein [Janibacter sp. HTCC2649]|uniref:zinc ribbon domain-containing protein n=1 Tax=Janibacter sp. HTCC2649 TaxID=313589 RepID=UPI0002E62B9A|nr:zinc ribbon domain-containing protein [Janibacter sp. HTCC2649]
MHCGSCGADLIPDARFCTRCGARVELGSLLGVGTDLPPVPAQPPVATEPQPVAPTEGHHGPGGNFTPGRIAAMVATFVVLTILGTFVLSQLFGSDVADAPNSAATSASTSAGPDTASPSGEPSPEPSPSESSTPEPSTPEPSASPTSTTALPAGARRCSQGGNDPVATAYSGNKDTSCAFSNAVRKAYREAGAATDPKPFRTYSTVTKRWYDVTCDTASPVRCQSADGAAVVFLGP